MLGNFTYYNPTKLYFGGGSVASLRDELPKYGPNIVLVYGSGSIKKNGIYDQVTAILKDCGKNVEEISGVMPNPTLPKVLEGVEICRRHQADFLLAVGGGSVCDYTKAVAAVSQAYYHHVLPYGLPKFKRFAEAVWSIDPAGKTEEEVALAGLDAMKAWMEEIGVVMHLTELGVDESMLDQIADLTFHIDGGYKALKRDEILAIFRESL